MSHLSPNLAFTDADSTVATLGILITVGEAIAYVVSGKAAFRHVYVCFCV